MADKNMGINAQTALMVSCVVQCVESICLVAKDVATCQTTPSKPTDYRLKSVRPRNNISIHAQAAFSLLAHYYFRCIFRSC